MTADDIERWQREMDLPKASAAYDPMSGWDRMRAVVREMEAAIAETPEQAQALTGLLWRARWLTEQQRTRATEWQAAAKARHEHYERTERENLRIPLSRLRIGSRAECAGRGRE